MRGIDLEKKKIRELKKRIKDKSLPPQVESLVLFEAERLKLISPASAEYGTVSNYIDWILSLPWEKSSPRKIDIKKVEDQNYFLPTALELKPLMMEKKLIVMGGIRDPISADKMIKDKQADFISMCRPFIYEPHLINRWASGDLTPAKCVSCNSCFMTLLTGQVYCAVRRKLEKREQRKLKRESKK